MTDNRFSLAGRTALVTGASSGLGAHFAAVLARSGAKVAITARRVDRLEKLAAEIRASGGTAVPVAMDVTDRASVTSAFDAAEKALGPKFDIRAFHDAVLDEGGLPLDVLGRRVDAYIAAEKAK